MAFSRVIFNGVQAECMVPDGRWDRIVRFPRWDDAESMETVMFELRVGEGVVSFVGISPKALAVQVVVDTVGMIGVFGVTSQSARGVAGRSDTGVGNPSVGPCFDNC